jgi:hypothetical protein
MLCNPAAVSRPGSETVDRSSRCRFNVRKPRHTRISTGEWTALQAHPSACSTGPGAAGSCCGVTGQASWPSQSRCCAVPGGWQHQHAPWAQQLWPASMQLKQHAPSVTSGLPAMWCALLPQQMPMRQLQQTQLLPQVSVPARPASTGPGSGASPAAAGWLVCSSQGGGRQACSVY